MSQERNKLLLSLYTENCIPLISRARGPYGKLWTEVFPSFMAQAQSARAMQTRKEKTRIHNLPYGPSKQG